MIRVENLSYGVPAKDLYNNISFTIDKGCHCAVIGSNGTGKSTLIDMLINTDNYIFDGKIIKDSGCRIGYQGRFGVRDGLRDVSVFEYLSERFVTVQREIADVCEEMASAEDMEAVFEKYQQLLDINEAMDGDNYENNICKQLNTAGMGNLKSVKISKVSGGEYKLLQIMKEMLLAPNLLILDEPDIFLDFANLNSLCRMINEYKGTLMVVTHNRYLLNHCFDKILHIENTDLQEYECTYKEYRCSILRKKLELRIQNLSEQEEIRRTEKMVETLRKRATLMVNPVIGKSVNAKQSQLDRLKERQIKAPFIEICEPEISFCSVDTEADDERAVQENPILSVSDYGVEFDKVLLRNVSFELRRGEKAAFVGANGTGKTTLIRDIVNNIKDEIHIDESAVVVSLPQFNDRTEDDERTVSAIMADAGFETKEKASAYLAKFCLQGDILEQKINMTSAGERNLLRIALAAGRKADLLILDEPTSHLDIHAQMAFEKAVAEYKGTVLFVSHDFYLIAGCADYVLFAENNTLRRMSVKKFRRMVYDCYFDRSYLEEDRERQELERKISDAFKTDNLAEAEKLCGELEELDRR